MDEQIEKVPSIGISYTVELPGKKALVMQSFVGRDEPVVDLDKVLDKMRDAAERQFAFAMIDHLKLQLEQEQKIAADHVNRISQVDENLKAEWTRRGKKGDPTLSNADQKAQREAYLHAEESKRRIAKVERDLAEATAKTERRELGA